MTVSVWRDGRQVCTWTITDPLTGPVDVDVHGTWFVADVTPVLDANDVIIALKARLNICGPAYLNSFGVVPVGTAVINSDVLARVRQDGVPCTDEWIRLLG